MCSIGRDVSIAVWRAGLCVEFRQHCAASNVNCLSVHTTTNNSRSIKCTEYSVRDEDIDATLYDDQDSRSYIVAVLLGAQHLPCVIQFLVHPLL